MTRIMSLGHLAAGLVIGLATSSARGSDLPVLNETAGTSHATIADAIAAASDGDELVASPGTYHELVNFMGKSITLRSTGGASETVIDATGLDDAAVTFETDEGRDSVLRGFTITGGVGNIDLLFIYRLGGGVFCFEASPTLVECVVTGNSADQGGGLHAFSCSPVVLDCLFHANEADFGGAIEVTQSSSPEIVNCRFVDNVAAEHGGALYERGMPIVVNCVFQGNTAGFFGGAVLTTDTELPLFANCTMFGNSAGSNGGAVYDIGIRAPVSTTLVNCVLWGNTSPQVVGDEGVFGVQPVVMFSNIEEPVSGPGNISADPRFVDAAGGDLRVVSTSPCVDRGSSASLPADANDLDDDGDVDETLSRDLARHVRVIGNAVDMGAFEVLPGDASADGRVGVDDIVSLITNWGDCGPCPPWCDADVNADCVVNVDDLLLVFEHWGTGLNSGR